jgi:hypothetical protein
VVLGYVPAQVHYFLIPQIGNEIEDSVALLETKLIHILRETLKSECPNTQSTSENLLTFDFTSSYLNLRRIDVYTVPLKSNVRVA